MLERKESSIESFSVDGRVIFGYSGVLKICVGTGLLWYMSDAVKELLPDDLHLPSELGGKWKKGNYCVLSSCHIPDTCLTH